MSYKEALNIDVSRREAAEQNPACIQVRNLMRGTSGQVAAAMEINVVNVALMTRQRLIPHCGTGNWPVNPCAALNADPWPASGSYIQHHEPHIFTLVLHVIISHYGPAKTIFYGRVSQERK